MKNAFAGIRKFYKDCDKNVVRVVIIIFKFHDELVNSHSPINCAIWDSRPCFSNVPSAKILSIVSCLLVAKTRRIRFEIKINFLLIFFGLTVTHNCVKMGFASRPMTDVMMFFGIGTVGTGMTYEIFVPIYFIM